VRTTSRRSSGQRRRAADRKDVIPRGFFRFISWFRRQIKVSRRTARCYRCLSHAPPTRTRSRAEAGVWACCRDHGGAAGTEEIQVNSRLLIGLGRSRWPAFSSSTTRSRHRFRELKLRLDRRCPDAVGRGVDRRRDSADRLRAVLSRPRSTDALAWRPAGSLTGTPPS